MIYNQFLIKNTTIMQINQIKHEYSNNCIIKIYLNKKWKKQSIFMSRPSGLKLYVAVFPSLAALGYVIASVPDSEMFDLLSLSGRHDASPMPQGLGFYGELHRVLKRLTANIACHLLVYYIKLKSTLRKKMHKTIMK
jgi:hypothetical protein